MNEALAGALAGGACVDQAGELDGPYNAPFITVICPRYFGDAASIAERISSMLDYVKSSPARPGSQVRVPSEPEWMRLNEAFEVGLDVDGRTLDALSSLANTLGVGAATAVLRDAIQGLDERDVPRIPEGGVCWCSAVSSVTPSC